VGHSCTYFQVKFFCLLIREPCFTKICDHSSNIRSFETFGSRGISLSPLREGSHGSRSNRSPSRNATSEGAQHASSLTRSSNSRNAHSSHDVRRNTPQQSHYPRHLHVDHPQDDHSSHYEERYQDGDQYEDTITAGSPNSRDAIRRFSEGEQPWNHALIGDKRSWSDMTREQQSPDRPHPDKLQTDLEAIQKEVKSDRGNHRSPKRPKTSRRSGGTRASGSRQGRRRDHDKDGRGEGSMAT
jgi:hypothetical protein